MSESLPYESGKSRRFSFKKEKVVFSVLVLLVSAGLVFLAVDYELNRPAQSSGQERTIPDGTVLVLRKVTFGKQHQFEAGRYAGGVPLFGGGGRQMCSTGTGEDSMVFWLSRRDAITGRALDFDWWSHCVAVDDHGCEFLDDNPGRSAFHSHGSMGDGGRPLRPLAAQSSESYDEIVVHSSLRPFRHAGGTFKLQVFDLEGTMVAEFDVSDPSPRRGQYPIWQAAALPATKNDRDLSVTLKQLTGTKGERYVGSDSKADTVRLNADLEISQNGKPATEWTRQNVKVLDAVGNVGSVWDSHLCPREEAWKLQVRVFRDSTAQFDPSEQWSVSGVDVPTAGNAERLGQTKTLQGVTVELLATGGGGKVTHFGLMNLNFSGGWGHSGSVGSGTKQSQCRIDTNSQSGAGNTTTVQCDFPHVIARVTGLTEDHYPPDLRATDDQGRDVKTHGPNQHADQTQFWFLEIPDDAKTLDLTLIVQKGRMVEFLVKPPDVQPLKGVRLDLASAEALTRRIPRLRRQIEQLQAMLAADPDNATVCGTLAAIYATAPEELRNAKKAVELAEKAAALEMNNAEYRNVLVLAYSRAGEHAKAVAIPAVHAENHEGRSIAMADYALAISFLKLGEAAKATETYTRALRLHKKLEATLSALEANELNNLRAEAMVQLLGGQTAEVFARGDQLARAEAWDKAAAEFARNLAIYPDEHWNWYRSGPLWVQLGDLETYRRHCQSVLDRFGDTDNAYVWERTAKLCFLVPDLLPDDPRPAALADRAVRVNPNFCWFLLAQAMAQYRAGKFQDALAWFEKSRQAQGNNAYSLAIINLFLAMSHHRLGQADAARDRLAEGVQIIEQQLPQPGSGDIGEGWHDWLMCQIVRREAESLVQTNKQQ